MNSNPSGEYSIQDLLRTISRRRGIVLGTAGVVFLLAILATLVMTRRYEATGVFELQKSSSDSLDLSDLMGGAAGGASDSLTLNTELQTEVSILKSDTLALRVIKDLNLEQNRDFKSTFNPISFVLGFVSPKGTHDQAGASLEESPNRRQRVLLAFSRHLDIKVDAGTRLIEVSFSNRDPKVAAAVVNDLIQALIDFTFQTKYNATNQVSSWLEGQLGDLRKQSEDLQTKVVSLQQGSGIYGVGGTDLQGKPVVYSPILDRLQQSSSLLTQAKMNLVIKESVYKIATSGDAELISQLAGTTMITESGQGVMNSLTVLQSLRTQEATLKAQIGLEASQYGSAAPKLIEDRASLKSVEQSIQQEIHRIAERAKNDYEVAVTTEKGAEDNYNADQSAAEKLNDKTIEYTILSREAEESDQLYQDLLKRLKEAGILESLHSSNLTVVDSASPPGKPNRPNVPFTLGVGLIMGIFLGLIAAFLVDAIDNKILDTDEIEQMGLPLLGILPQLKSADMEGKMIYLDSRATEFNESIRHLRSALLIAKSGSPPRVLLVTSGSPAEGKSTISLNLAAALAQLQKKVLLVEGDMRRPVLAKRLRLPASGGLSTFLSDQSQNVQPEQVPDHPYLYAMQAGPVPPYPSELLGAAPLQDILDRLREEFDFIVIDSPPILPVTDVQSLMPYVDATVLVTRSGRTTRLGLQRAYKMLVPHVKNPDQPAIGVVLNGVGKHSAAYYGYYGGYGYKSYYSPEEGSNE